MLRFLTFFGLGLAALLIAGIYGALHDQISYTVSNEYFTKFKHIQFGLADSPLPERVKVALTGFLATWWMGVPIGFFVGVFSFLHSSSALMWKRTLRAYGVVVLVTACSGLFGLAQGYLFAKQDKDRPVFGPWGHSIDQPVRYHAVGQMHNFGCLGGVLGIFAGVPFQFYQKRKRRG